MKTEINRYGQLILTPENSFETYALQQWADKNQIKQEDIMRAETFHYRGSSIKIIERKVTDTTNSVV